MLFLPMLRKLFSASSSNRIESKQNPSLGEEYTQAKVGMNRCWQAIGPARDLFDVLSPKISAVLEDWEAPDDAFLAWSIFMLGPCPESAIPTLIVYGGAQHARKSLCEAIHVSGLLQRYRVALENRAIAPDFNCVDPIQHQSVQYMSGHARTIILEPDQGLHDTVQLQGSAISVTNTSDEVRNATIGLVFSLSGRTFATTVAHAFSTSLNNEKHSFPGAKIKHCTHSVVFGNPILSNGANTSGASDYAILPILSHVGDSVHIPNYHELNQRIATKPRDTLIRIASDLNNNRTGTLSGTPAFIRLPGTRGFQQVWTVHMDRPVQEGDCGSMITDSESGHIYGHIIAGAPNSTLAYILPAHRLLDTLSASYHIPLQSPRYSRFARLIGPLTLTLLVIEVVVLFWLLSFCHIYWLRVLIAGCITLLLLALISYLTSLRPRESVHAPRHRLFTG